MMPILRIIKVGTISQLLLQIGKAQKQVPTTEAFPEFIHGAKVLTGNGAPNNFSIDDPKV